MSYLLIGGSGFLSKHIQNLFKKKNINFQAISSNNIDLTSTKSSQKLSKFSKKYRVIFLSAITPDKGKDINSFNKNISMVQNFVKYFPNKNIIHFTYISSDAVYGSGIKKIRDITKPSPDDLYGCMHFVREIFIESCIEKNQLLILRPTLIYGKGDTHNSYGPNRFIKSAKEEKKINLFGKGLDTRDHIHVENVSELIFKFSRDNITGKYNLVTGKSHSFNYIAKLIKKNSNETIEINYIKNNNKISKRSFIPSNKVLKGTKMIDIDIGIKNYLI